MAREHGTVKFYSSEKGYGFITPDDDTTGEDVFVHFSALEMEGFKCLGQGEAVEFTIEYDSTKNKKLATRVTGPGGAALVGGKKGDKGGGFGRDGGGFSKGKDKGGKGKGGKDGGFGKGGGYGGGKYGGGKDGGYGGGYNASQSNYGGGGGGGGFGGNYQQPGGFGQFPSGRFGQ